MILYDYFRSTASHRVRIALHIKGIDYQTQAIALTDHLQNEAGYRRLNPQQLVPCLEVDGQSLSQSLAIIDYLEAQYPTPPLFPTDTFEQAQVKSIMLFIACEMHPLNNLRVREHLHAQFNADEHAIKQWCQHWLKTGFERLEASLKQTSKGRFCYHDILTAADVCLVPQILSAERFEVSLEAYPLIQSIYQHCATLPAFII